ARIPEDVRSAVRDAAREDDSREAIETLRRFPVARTANTWIAIAATMQIVMCAAVVAGVRAAPSIVIVALLIWIALPAITRRALVGRRAFRRLITRLAARPPQNPSTPFGCRACGAPLPALAEGTIVATCIYCRAANVCLAALPPGRSSKKGRGLQALLD